MTMNAFRVQIHETRLHDIDVEAASVEEAAVLAEAVFRVMIQRPAGEFGGATTAIVTDLATGERWGVATRTDGTAEANTDDER